MFRGTCFFLLSFLNPKLNSNVWTSRRKKRNLCALWNSLKCVTRPDVGLLFPSQTDQGDFCRLFFSFRLHNWHLLFDVKRTRKLIQVTITIAAKLVTMGIFFESSIPKHFPLSESLISAWLIPPPNQSKQIKFVFLHSRDSRNGFEFSEFV